MQDDLKEYFRAYRLPKDIEKHAVVDKKKKDIKNYQLELVMEAETAEEILNTILPVQFLYEVGYEHVLQFEIEDGYIFRGIGAYGERTHYCYHTDGCAFIDGAHAFQYIYENYDKEGKEHSVTLYKKFQEYCEDNLLDVKMSPVAFTQRLTKHKGVCRAKIRISGSKPLWGVKGIRIKSGFEYDNGQDSALYDKNAYSVE